MIKHTSHQWHCEKLHRLRSKRFGFNTNVPPSAAVDVTWSGHVLRTENNPPPGKLYNYQSIIALIQWRSNRELKACSARRPIAAGEEGRRSLCGAEGGRGFWNPCTWSRSNLATPLHTFAGLESSTVAMMTGASPRTVNPSSWSECCLVSVTGRGGDQSWWAENIDKQPCRAHYHHRRTC